MSACCARSSCALPKKQACPCCGQLAQQVTLKTVLQQIKQPWQWQNPPAHVYFCANRGCELAYFSAEQPLFYQAQLHSNMDLICHCFAVSHADLQQNPQIKAFVLAQTKQGLCSCDSHNPSGRCCLSQFPKS